MGAPEERRGRRWAVVAAVGVLAQIAALAAPAPAPAGAATTFSDVGVSHRFATEIGWLVDEGLAEGYGDGTFKPTAPMSRQAIVAMLHRLAGSPAVACDADRFTDVPTGHLFCSAITWANDVGVVMGFQDGTFKPTEPMTRQAMAAMLLAFTGITPPPCAPATVDDDAKGDADHPFCAAITWLVTEGITTGYADLTFHPVAAVSRQATAAMLHRLMHGTCAVESGTGGVGGVTCTTSGVLATHPRMGIYGDSAALGLGWYSGKYFSSATRKLTRVGGHTPLGCGITMSHRICKTAAEWGAIAKSNNTDIALIYTGTWETQCIKPSTEDWETCRRIGDPEFDDYLRRELDERSAAFLANGVDHVIYVKTNRRVGAGVTPPLSDAWLRWHAIVDEHAASDPRIEALDMSTWWIRDRPRDLHIRDDGYHFDRDTWITFEEFFETRLYWYLWLPHVRAAS